jgi:hypothetical protein
VLLKPIALPIQPLLDGGASPGPIVEAAAET